MSSSYTDFEKELLNAWENMKVRKIKPEKKVVSDPLKEMKLEKIKRESLMRANK